jgi:hypothetical protein
MSLRPLRQQEQVNIDYISPWTQERGGILTYATASGITFAQYAHVASGAVPIGIQLNDVENVNFSREVFPQRIRNTEVPCGIVGIGVQGDFETDWVHQVGQISTGDLAYVGPSGTFTNSSSFGGALVGKFLGTLKANVHPVVFRGLGFSREFVDPVSKQIVWENNPSDMLTVLSPGFVKIRIDSSLMTRGSL